MESLLFWDKSVGIKATIRFHMWEAMLKMQGRIKSSLIYLLGSSIEPGKYNVS